MKQLRIYLDTSVVNFLFAEDAPDFHRVTVQFFDHYAKRYELFISEIVLLEIMRTKDIVRREALLGVLRQHPISVLPFDPQAEIAALADAYRKQGVIPESKTEDALHVAHATVHEMDILLSWNFKHLANIHREMRIEQVNREHGYMHPLRLVSPMEVEDEN